PRGVSGGPDRDRRPCLVQRVEGGVERLQNGLAHHVPALSAGVLDSFGQLRHAAEAGDSLDDLAKVDNAEQFADLADELVRVGCIRLPEEIFRAEIREVGVLVPLPWQWLGLLIQLFLTPDWSIASR